VKVRNSEKPEILKMCRFIERENKENQPLLDTLNPEFQE
jgi:hypothetical protein